MRFLNLWGGVLIKKITGVLGYNWGLDRQTFSSGLLYYLLFSSLRFPLMILFVLILFFNFFVGWLALNLKFGCSPSFSLHESKTEHTIFL